MVMFETIAQWIYACLYVTDSSLPPTLFAISNLLQKIAMDHIVNKHHPFLIIIVDIMKTSQNDFRSLQIWACPFGSHAVYFCVWVRKPQK